MRGEKVSPNYVRSLDVSVSWRLLASIVNIRLAKHITTRGQSDNHSKSREIT